MGAMIPGALVALVLCWQLKLPFSVCGRAAAFGAVGVGFGGQETYGQTVRLVTDGGPLVIRGLVGLAVKGGTWGLLGGGMIAVACVSGRELRRHVFVALALLVVGTGVGWWAIDEPKRIYFSNLLDRPREEIWGGLALGGCAFLAWMSAILSPRSARVVISFAVLGAIGGGFGFALGGLSYSGGMALGWTSEFYPGWKQMEFIFGFCFGAALGLAAVLQNPTIQEVPTVAVSRQTRASHPLYSLLTAIVAGALIVACLKLPFRFNYTIAGALLLALAFESERAAWQIAITITAGAFLVYIGAFFAEHHAWIQPVIPTAIALLLALGLSYRIAVRHELKGRESVRWELLTLLWIATGAALARAAWHPVITPALMIVAGVFVLGALVITRLAYFRS